MAGGTWGSQNKVLPGAYVDVYSTANKAVSADDLSGVVFTTLSGLNWGQPGVVEVNQATDFLSVFGKTIDAPELLGLKLILLNASKVYVFNLNGGTEATGTSVVLPWTFTAKYPGTTGNNISVIVTPDPANATRFIVKTLLGTVVVNTQTVTSASDLVANNYIVPAINAGDVADDGASKLGALVSPVQITLSDGTTVEETGLDSLITAAETYEFNTIVAPMSVATAPIHTLLAATAIRLREEQGRKVQAVIPYDESYDPDHEGVIVIANGVKLADGTVYDTSIMAGWFAGATAAAAVNQSLTYTQVPGAVDAVPRLNEESQISAVQAGRLVFDATRDLVRVLVDINSLHTFTPTKNESFTKNRVLRVLDAIANNTRETWEDSFIGKVTNDATGRDLFKANRAEYVANLQAQGAVENFTPDDITVTEGATKDSVVATINVQPTDAMEKLYMTVYVN